MDRARAKLRQLARGAGITREGSRVLGLAALLNAALFGFFLIVFTPYYETNDDLNMQLIASGFYTGQPSEYLVFTNVVIGWMLRALYTIWNGCNWYAIYLMGVHYCSLTLLAYLILRRRRSWLFALLYAGFFLVAEGRMLLNLQFTTTAFVAGLTGLLLMTEGLRPDRRPDWPMMVAGAACVTVMGLIRAPSAMLLAFIAVPFLIEHFGIGGWRRLVAMGLACAGLVLAFEGINRWYYWRNPDWAGFLEYNRIHGEIRVSPMKRLISQAASAAGWSQNDAWMFSNWYFSDPEVFGSTAKLRQLADRLRELPQARPYAGRWGTILADLPRALGPDAGHLLKIALFGAAWCLFFAGARRGRYFVVLAALYVVFGLLTFLLLDTSHLPQRVAVNLPLFMLAICLYWASGFPGAAAAGSRISSEGLRETWTKKGLRLAMWAGAAVWAIFFARLLVGWNQALQSTNGASRYLKAEISPRVFEPMKTLLPSGKKPLVIPVTFETHLQQSLFFHSRMEEIPFSMIPYSWVSHSPLFSEVLKQHELVPYSLSLVDRPDIFFLMQANWEEPLRVFYREHYGLEVRFDLVLDARQMPEYHDCELRLYQAHRVTRETGAGERDSRVGSTAETRHP